MELPQELIPGRRKNKLKWNKSNTTGTYCTRSCHGNFVSLLHEKAQQSSPAQRKLFSVELIEKEQSRVKVHYIGFSNEFDEWKDESEVEVINGEEIPSVDDYSTYKKFSLYDELRTKIKRAFSCN